MKNFLFVVIAMLFAAPEGQAQSLNYLDLGLSAQRITESGIPVHRSEGRVRADLGFGPALGLEAWLSYGNYGGPGYEGTRATSFSLAPYVRITPPFSLGPFLERSNIDLSGGGGGIFNYWGINGQFAKGPLTIEGFWGRGDISDTPMTMTLGGLRGSYAFENGLVFGGGFGRETATFGGLENTYDKKTLMLGYSFGLGQSGRKALVAAEFGRITMENPFSGAVPFDRVSLTLSIPLGRGMQPRPDFGARSIQTEIPFL